METTRRTFLEGFGAAAALSVIGIPLGATTPAAPVSTMQDKCLFWIAAATPCDKNLKFDEGLYKDMMAYFKEQGADGIVALGSTGEYPSFSFAERKKIAETALMHRTVLKIIFCTDTF